VDNQETWSVIPARIVAMKRFDRAMYAFFLLALLADVARANVPVTAGGDSNGGLILSAASQLRVDPAGAAALVRRRSNGPFVPMARFKKSSVALSRWARILSEHSRQLTPVILAAWVPGPGFSSGLVFDSSIETSSPSLVVFDHTGSPAP
jgi:hypothetical protein